MGSRPSRRESERAAHLAAIIEDQYTEVLTSIDVLWPGPKDVTFVMYSDDIKINLPLSRPLLLDEFALPDLQVLYLAGQAILGVLNSLVDEMVIDVLLLGQVD